MTHTAALSPMFSDVVMEIPKSKFEDVLDEFKEKKSVKFDRDLTAEDLKAVVERFKGIYKEAHGRGLPAGPQGSADGSRQGRVPLLGQPPRHRTTAA